MNNPSLRALLGLLILGVIFGDLVVGFVLVVYLWRNRWRSSLFPYVGNLFLCVALAILSVYVAVSHLPRNPLDPELPQPRPLAFRVWLFTALILAGLGIWPAALKLLLASKVRRADGGTKWTWPND